jgi:hypothetical protein
MRMKEVFVLSFVLISVCMPAVSGQRADVARRDDGTSERYTVYSALIEQRFGVDRVQNVRHPS